MNIRFDDLIPDGDDQSKKKDYGLSFDDLIPFPDRQSDGPSGRVPSPSQQPTIGQFIGRAEQSASDIGTGPEVSDFTTGLGRTISGVARGAAGGLMQSLSDITAPSRAVKVGPDGQVIEDFGPLTSNLPGDRVRDAVSAGAGAAAETLEAQAASDRMRVQELRPNGPAGFAYDVTTGLGNMVASVVAARLTGLPSVGVLTMADQIALGEYAERRANGEDEATASREATIAAGLEAIPERLFGVFDNIVTPGSMNRLRQVFAEGGAEALTAELQILDSSLRQGENVGDAGDILENIAYSAAVGGAMGGMIGPSGPTGLMSQDPYAEGRETAANNMRIGAQSMQQDFGSQGVFAQGISGQGMADMPRDPRMPSEIIQNNFRRPQVTPDRREQFRDEYSAAEQARRDADYDKALRQVREKPVERYDRERPLRSAYSPEAAPRNNAMANALRGAGVRFDDLIPENKRPNYGESGNNVQINFSKKEPVTSVGQYRVINTGHSYGDDGPYAVKGPDLVPQMHDNYEDALRDAERYNRNQSVPSERRVSKKPSDDLINKRYDRPEDVPSDVMKWVTTNQSLLASDANDATRWGRIVDTINDDRLSGDVTLYRATNDGEEIRPGDWVTTDESYAKDHLKRYYDGKGKIIKIDVNGEDVLASPTGNYEEAIYAPIELSGPIKNKSPKFSFAGKRAVDESAVFSGIDKDKVIEKAKGALSEQIKYDTITRAQSFFDVNKSLEENGMVNEQDVGDYFPTSYHGKYDEYARNVIGENAEEGDRVTIPLSQFPDELIPKEITIPGYASKEDFDVVVEAGDPDDPGSASIYIEPADYSSLEEKGKNSEIKIRNYNTLDDVFGSDAHKAQYAAFIEMLDQAGISYSENSSASSGSRYVYVTDPKDENKQYKIRFSDHSNQAYSEEVADVNITTDGGSGRIEDAIKLIDRMYEKGSKGPKFSFAGEKAKTANVQKFNDAKRMKDEGIDSEIIRQQTGWSEGIDGKWRFEINDSEMTIADSGVFDQARNRNGAPLAAVMDHPVLYEAYPELAMVKVIVKPNADGTARYSASENNGWGAIYIDHPDESPLRKGGVRSQIIHEVQHAIQEKEGFATGYTYSQAKQDKVDSENRIENIDKQISRLRGLADSADQIEKGIYEDQIERLLVMRSNITADRNSPINRSPMQRYMAMPGEVEARNTEARLDLDDTEEGKRQLKKQRMY